MALFHMSMSSTTMTGMQTGTRWRVLLVDDHAIVREGLAMLIGAQSDMEVIAQAGGGREAVHMAQSCQPDVVVLDVSMPDMGGPDAAERIMHQSPSSRVLALTRHGDQAYLQRMLRAGAHGYVLKRAAGDDLLDAIRTVAVGGSYVDPQLASAWIARSVGRQEGKRDSPALPLSERELQTLKLIAWGKSNKEVAAQLGISVKTAEFYKASGLAKLGLRSRTDILRYALAEGWLTDEGDPG